MANTAAYSGLRWGELAGRMPDSAIRLVSLRDPDARPIRKGRIDRPVEFGYKAQVTDNDDGIVVDYATRARHQEGRPLRVEVASDSRG